MFSFHPSEEPYPLSKHGVSLEVVGSDGRGRVDESDLRSEGAERRRANEGRDESELRSCERIA